MYDDLAPPQAHERVLAGAMLIDVRTPEEFELGAPADSVNVPVLVQGPFGMAANPHFVQTMRKIARADQDLVMSCRSGGRSAHACQLLAEAGFTGTLTNVAGGYHGGPGPDGRPIPGWLSAGLPVQTHLDGKRWSDVAG